MLPDPPMLLDPRAIDAVKEILSLTKWERHTYLVATVITIAVLLALAVYLCLSSRTAWVGLTLLAAPGGVIVFLLSRILTMWNNIVKLLFRTLPPENTQ
jgi:hypothetical protein